MVFRVWGTDATSGATLTTENVSYGYVKFPGMANLKLNWGPHGPTTNRVWFWTVAVNIPDSTTPIRSTSSASPITPPMMYAVRQCTPMPGIAPPSSPASTPPERPNAATIVVPMPRVWRAISSLTSVMPAPSSPASPMPAASRHHE